MSRKFPFTAWALGGTFIPKQVEITEPRWASGNWLQSSGTAVYHVSDLFETKGEAIARGREKIEQQEARIAKQQAGIAKKRANLDKHDDAAGE